jgi:putative ABC transport system permease protein
MKLLRYFRVAVDSVLANKLRAILTMLGIIIGVAAVLIIMGLGSGATASITAEIESSGTNLLFIASRSNGAGAGSTLTIQDAESLSDPTVFSNISFVAPQYTGNSTITAAGVDGTYQVLGTTTDYAAMQDLDFESGQFFTAEHQVSAARVVVLGATVADDIFGHYGVVGQTVRIDNHIFDVIGVLKETGGTMNSIDSQVLVPLEVAQGRLFNVPRYRGSYTVSTINVQLIDRENIDATELQVEQVLRMNHMLGADDENDFLIVSQADMIDMVSQVTGILTALLGSIGAVSLLVGGIGIMNIMLVSVTERTREIGLRKAVGAHNNDILLQFLIESLVLCVSGGLIGIGLSYGLTFLLSLIPAIPFALVIEPWALLLALTVSSASGVIFGLYPAIRATRLDPIEALRFE